MSSDYPAFAFRVDEDTRSWALFRQTKTQERPVVVRTRERTFWFGQDREESNGTREPVRNDFLDAVAALFFRGPAGQDWTLDPIFDALEWYESECIDDLREIRNETSSARSPPEINDKLREQGYDVPENPRAMPSEAWDLVTAARSHFALTDSRAFKAGDTSTRDHDRGDHPDDGSLLDFSNSE
ncbi:hypothetical protein [Natronorubrum sp. DTA7]|uniref:hypothetical protein n=1 Tax=Natronorubrum sp. DTA7 TaxID=3447016 RepID=UPI003F852F6C